MADSKIPKRKRLPQRGSIEKKPAVPLSAQAWKHKLASTDGSRMQTLPSAGSPLRDSDACSPTSSSTPDPNPSRKRKQKQHPGSLKRQKRSSVESRTVSVTRLSVPICDDSSTSEQEPSHDSSTLSENESSVPQDGELLQCIKEEPLSPEEKRPRSLRVSLSFPDEFETGSPFRKITSPPVLEGVAKSPKGPQPNMLPLWEDITTAVPVTSSQDNPSPVDTRSSSDATFTPSPTTIGATVDLPSASMLASSPWQDSDRKVADLQVETITVKTVTESPTKCMASVAPQPSDVVEQPAPIGPNTTQPQSTVVMHPKPPLTKPKLTSPIRKPAIVSTSTVTTLPQPHNKPLTHIATNALVPSAASAIQSEVISQAIAVASPAVPFTASPLPQPTQQTSDKKRPASLPKQPAVAVVSTPFTKGPGTPEFTQATPSNVITSTPTLVQPAPKPPTKQGPPVQPPKAATLTPGSTYSKKLPPAATGSHSQTPIQSLVSSAMSTALASVVGSINNGERQTDSLQQKMQTSSTKLVLTSDGDDVIITGVETKIPVSQSERTQKQAYVPHHSHHFSPRQERQQELFQGGASDLANMTPKKVVAKTVVRA